MIIDAETRPPISTSHVTLKDLLHIQPVELSQRNAILKSWLDFHSLHPGFMGNYSAKTG